MKHVDSSADAPPEGFRAALLDFYDADARPLPWRGEPDPYRVLVSEVMLQQTRVETVKRYYGPWLERFPDVDSLARAGEDEVLKAWEGLGYYRRARDLHHAARVVREEMGGRLPDDARSLRALPGVGAYTAGAVASIAFGRVEPAVDGNVRRVLARLFDEPRPTAAWLRDRAAALVEPERPGDWNQALMELGATVCTSRSPSCDRCPLRRWCGALAAGTVRQRPAATARRSVRCGHFVVGVFECEGRALLVRRPVGGLLGGLWAFPESPSGAPAAAVAAPPTSSEARVAIEHLCAALGLVPVGAPEQLPEQGHRFTHLRATYHPWRVWVASAAAPVGEGVVAGPRARQAGEVRRAAEHGLEEGAPGERGPFGDRAWVTPIETETLALPVAQRRILDHWAASR